MEISIARVFHGLCFEKLLLRYEGTVVAVEEMVMIR